MHAVQYTLIPTDLIFYQQKEDTVLYDEPDDNNYSKATNSGYEIDNGSGCTRLPLVKANDDHDYDEPYFEPATEVDTLINQLERLEVPTIQQESLKYEYLQVASVTYN